MQSQIYWSYNFSFELASDLQDLGLGISVGKERILEEKWHIYGIVTEQLTISPNTYKQNQDQDIPHFPNFMGPHS